MNAESPQLLSAAASRLHDLLQGKIPPPLPEPDDAAPEERELIRTVNKLIDAVAEIQRFILPLSQGELQKEIPRTGNFLSSPFKELHARLMHLTWQTEQVARGDYNQRIDFMGNFSTAFNTMVATLAERESILREKVDQLAERSAELSATNEKLRLEITMRKRAEKTIEHLANHDSLTGLANRRLLEELFRQVESYARRERTMLAVLFFDLDDFKGINDTYGHKTGDEVLKIVALRLQTALRGTDIVARLGGDEFLLVLSNIKTPEDGVHLADKVQAEVCRPLPLESGEILLGASIGISLYPRDGEELEELIRTADIAMYRVKQNGKGAVLLSPRP